MLSLEGILQFQVICSVSVLKLTMYLAALTARTDGVALPWIPEASSAHLTLSRFPLELGPWLFSQP